MGENIFQEIYLQLGADQGQPQMVEWFVFHNAIAIYLSLALKNTNSFRLTFVSDGRTVTHNTLCI